MNITPINTQIQNFKARKMPRRIPEVKFINLGKYEKNILNSINSELEGLAYFYNRDIKIAQKNEALFVNSGNITSRLELSKLYEEAKHNIEQTNPYKYILDFIKLNIRVNERLSDSIKKTIKNDSKESALEKAFKTLENNK